MTRQSLITVVVQRVGDELTYTRRVGRIVTHSYGMSAPIDRALVEVLRNDPRRFEDAYEEAAA